MQKISIIVENDFGDNLNEWLSLEGFETSRLNSKNLQKNAENTDVFICGEEDLGTIGSDEFKSLTDQKPCIILGEDKAMAPKWLQKYFFLKMPFSFEELLGTISGCKPLLYSEFH